MNYNGKEIEVTCTLENDTPKITITAGKSKFSFNNINRAAVFLASVYGGTKEEALIALNNLLQDIDKNTVQTETKESNHQDLINNLEYGHEDRCIEISIADFFRMSMEEFDEYLRTEFLKKGIDIDKIKPPPLPPPPYK